MKSTLDILASDGPLAKLLSRSWALKRELERIGIPVLRSSVPVLYFGDVRAYFASPVRVITAALNPSNNEFPGGTSAARFPGAREKSPQCHFAALNAYFEHDPYWKKWFQHIDALLEGLAVGFRVGRCSRALHTDLCSPLATEPTFTGLPLQQQHELERSGMPLWSDLVELLDPDVILMSGSKPMRDRVPAFVDAEWAVISGSGCKSIWLSEMHLWGRRRLGVFGLTNNVPFGSLSFGERWAAGKLVTAEIIGRGIPRSGS
jgi:hypothetical protein